MKNTHIFILLTALFLTALLCLFLGPVHTTNGFILKEVRLPRVLMGLLVGFALAYVGAAFQSLLRNPLADPYVLGTSSGASLGALLGLELKKFFSGWFLSSLTFYLCIFAGALGATALSYFIARRKKDVSVTHLVLAGVIVTTLCGSLIMLFFSFKHQDSFTLFFFLMGSLMEYSWATIALSFVLIGLGCWVMSRYLYQLDALCLGEEKAVSLGVHTTYLKYIFFGLGSLVVSAAVALAGSIGFVGLVVPHLARLCFGARNAVVVPIAACLGAILLMLADALARTLWSPLEVPVGIIMALLGAPFFLWLLKTKR